MEKIFLEMTENIVGKGENAGYQHFLLFPQFFQMSLSEGRLSYGMRGKGLDGENYLFPTYQTSLCESARELFHSAHKSAVTVTAQRMMGRGAIFLVAICSTVLVVR